MVRENLEHMLDKPVSKSKAAIDFTHQAEKLAYLAPHQENDTTGSTQAVEAKFITAQDPVIVTADGGRLPAVPIEEAKKLNDLRDEVDDRDPSESAPIKAMAREARDGTLHGASPVPEGSQSDRDGKGKTDAPLKSQTPPSRTNPLFPPMPLYGPPTLLRKIHVSLFRCSSAVLSLCFLLVIILGALFTSIPEVAKRQWLRLTFRNPDESRPFYNEEEKRRQARRKDEKA